MRVSRLVILILCTAASIPVSAAGPSGQSDCAEIRDWLSARLGDLPRTYEEIVQYSEAYRQAIFAALPPEDKSAVWRGHLETRLREDAPRLSPAQRGLIVRAIELGSPELYRPGAVDTHQDAAERLEAEIKQSFTPAEASRLFARLGPAGERSHGTWPSLHCSCNFWDPGPCVGLHECRGDIPCQPSSSGCGTLLRSPCDAYCRPVE